jgi:hypothetical protein
VRNRGIGIHVIAQHAHAAAFYNVIVSSLLLGTHEAAAAASSITRLSIGMLYQTDLSAHVTVGITACAVIMINVIIT